MIPMSPRKVSRRDWMIRTACAVAANALPLGAFPSVGEAQTPQQPYADSRAGWMQDPRYCWGVMTHYLADWQVRDHNLVMDVDRWNKLVDGFDVEGMAKRLESVGAGHYQLSIGQNSGYYLSPNPVYDKITRTSTEQVRSLSGPGRGFLRAPAPARHQAVGLSSLWCSGLGQSCCLRSRMAERSVPQQEFSTQMGAGDRGVVPSLGKERGRMVVRWLLLPQLDVSLCRSAQFREFRCRRPLRESRFVRRIQSWSGQPLSLHEPKRRLHRRRDQQPGFSQRDPHCRGTYGRHANSHAQFSRQDVGLGRAAFHDGSGRRVHKEN